MDFILVFCGASVLALVCFSPFWIPTVVDYFKRNFSEGDYIQNYQTKEFGKVVGIEVNYSKPTYFTLTKKGVTRLSESDAHSWRLLTTKNEKRLAQLSIDEGGE